MIPYSSKIEDLIKELGTDAAKGLTSKQVVELQAKYGKNELKAKKKKTLFSKFMDQFKDAMIIILLVAAIISFVIALTQNESSEFFEPILILAIVILNAVMGVVQENKAEKAMEALKSMASPHAKVIRDGEKQTVESWELVPGDILVVEAGDYIPADARLIISISVKSEEAALTGESVPSEKDSDAVVAPDAALGDHHNMIHTGCAITYGRGTAVVTSIGMSTEMGKIANLLEGAEETETPLQQKLGKLGKSLGIVALAACAVVFVVGVIDNRDSGNKLYILEMFMVAVSLAVAAIPEGLPAIVTIVLSIGMGRMAKKNAIIRRLTAVETLGSASIICSDKTGTLTQNRMTVTKVYTEGGEVLEFNDDMNDDVKKMLNYATLCCDGTVCVLGDKVKHIGDPTETAMVYAAYRNGGKKEELDTSYKRIGELPFDSDRKLMTTVHNIDGKIVVITKGAYEAIEAITIKGDMPKAYKSLEYMSSQALRVLAVAYKVIDKLPAKCKNEELECGLTFMGLIGMIDPPRPEVMEAVKTCKLAGIKPVMITGDQVITAVTIARDLGIFNEGDISVTGKELAKMTDEELSAKVAQISVYARVTPEDKIRIVRAWQAKGYVVSMTGDGVNDAPALKAADIGCAMGITGTDVAKGAADMTLTDDNFATIVEAVKEGRGIYANIRKVIGYLLGTNIGEILVVFFAMILWGKTPLLPMQLLWLNLVTDSLPAIALGMEPVEKDIMTKKPNHKNESIFAHGLGIMMGFQGFWFGIITLAAFYIGHEVGIPGVDPETVGQTCAFIVLSCAELVQAYNMRSDHSLFKIGMFSNRKLNSSVLISFAMVLGVVAIPFIANIFGMVTLTLNLYIVCALLIISPLPVTELVKAVLEAKNRKKNGSDNK